MRKWKNEKKPENGKMTNDQTKNYKLLQCENNNWKNLKKWVNLKMKKRGNDKLRIYQIQKTRKWDYEKMKEWQNEKIPSETKNGQWEN